jgi:transcriptional regulator with XRE-family HTH domain
MKKLTREQKRLSIREKEIGLRLREVREFLHLPQAEFAEKLGIGRARLSSYEEGRYPVRWEIALSACQRFSISEHWLATGGSKFQRLDGKPVPFGNTGVRAAMFRPGDAVLQTLRPGLLFSAAYDSSLRLAYWKMLGQCARFWTRIDFTEDADLERLRQQMEWALTMWCGLIHPRERARFCKAMIQAGGLLFDSLATAPYDLSPKDSVFKVAPKTALELELESEWSKVKLQ